MDADIKIYNLTIDNVNFTDDQIMVLIESSQTIKIVVENIYFNATFDFDSNSTIYSDEGSGYFSNNMTVTIAVQPNY